MTLQKSGKLTLRPLERTDLRFVHGINNDATIMRYWFEEPFETFTELTQLYDEHIHDLRERRFICESPEGDAVGVVELVEINYIHRRGEFQIIIAPEWQGRGYATEATLLAINYAFKVLNLHKLYLIVDVENKSAVHIYEKCGFKTEGVMPEEFFSAGSYHDALRMSIFQRDVLGPKR